MSEQNPGNGTEEGRGKLAQRHAEANKPCPPVRQGGSAAHRNQQEVPRSLVGTDSYVNSRVTQRSKVQPKTQAPTGKVRKANVSRQHP